MSVMMTQTAKHFRDVFFGGNWTCSNLKDNLAGLTWQQATTKVHTFNTIAALVYHIDYYLDAVLKVFRGGPLDAHDKYSFDLPPIQSQQDWDDLVNKTFADAEACAGFIEKMPDSALWKNLADEKYGNYHRNIHGMIEHTHYHLGQIVIIKKLVLLNEKDS